jgi:hypothetical protein
MKHAPLPLALTFWVLTAAPAAQAAGPPPNLVDCSQMADPGERLKCYDTQMAAMKAAASPPAVSAPPAATAAPKGATVPKPEVAAAAATPVTPSATPEAAQSAEQQFGALDLPRTAREKVDKPDKALLSSIASIREVHPKLWLIVLTNGQTWRQEGTQITMFFRPGYDVRIEKGLFEGDFRMSTTQTGAKNWVQVSRVQ